MFKNLVAVSLFGIVALGCAHGQRSYIDPVAAMNPEPAAMWSRPQEVGYTLGERIQGEAAINCIFWVICWGAEDGGIGSAFAGLLGAATGQSAPSDPLVRAAAAGAVLSAPTETDGIFVLNHETDSFNIFLYSRRTARVIGKAVRLHPIGEVSQERADKVRNLRAMSGANLQITGVPMP